MWTAIFSAIAAIPKILQYIETFALWLIEQIYIAKEKKLREELEKAVEKSKKEKDTSGLDDLFSGK